MAAVAAAFLSIVLYLFGKILDFVNHLFVLWG